MHWYLVSYDLNRPGQNYDALWTALRQMGGFRVMLSAWIVRSPEGSLPLIDRLTVHLDRNDKMLVTEMTNNTAWTGTIAAEMKKVFPG